MAVSLTRTDTRSIEIPDEEAMMALGARLHGLAQPGDVITLRGDLGAGKTVLARGFIRAACVPEGEDAKKFDVPSPTFTLVQVYEPEADGKEGGERPAFPIWHFDFYRIEEAAEIRELGFEEALDGGVSLIEWPENGASVLPDERLDLVVANREGSLVRDVTLKPGPGWEERIADV